MRRERARGSDLAGSREWLSVSRSRCSVGATAHVERHHLHTPQPSLRRRHSRLASTRVVCSGAICNANGRGQAAATPTEPRRPVWQARSVSSSVICVTQVRDLHTQRTRTLPPASAG